MALAPVSVVVPIQQISVIFRLLFNVYLNREYERIDAGIVITILSVIGAVALGVNTEAVLSWFDAVRHSQQYLVGDCNVLLAPHELTLNF